MERAILRTQMLANHLNIEGQMENLDLNHTTAAGKKDPNDVVVVATYRTAIGKAKRGNFKDTSQEKLLIAVLKKILQSTGIDPKLVADIVVGNVLPPSSLGATEVRIAALLAGFPKEVSVCTVNRQCSSGLQAIANVAASIKAGYYDIGIGAGVESMSTYDMASYGNMTFNEEALADPIAKGCYMTMGQTSEEVAARYKISREEQDQFAFNSYQRASNALKTGQFKDEIVPVTTVVKDAQGNEKTVTVDQDEGPRPTTLENLAKLKPAFKPDGFSTAGNSSQTSDGAAATLLARRSVAEKLKLPIIATLRSFAAVGVEPAIMGVGPAYAIPEAVKKAGITLADIDIFEINEAFASQALFCVKHLGISLDKVNPNGGAIALGHPLGCTGARMTATVINELRKSKQRYGVVSMCIGSGMGAAAVYELELP